MPCHVKQNLDKKIGENISKNVSSRYSSDKLAARHKLFDLAKHSATDVLKTASKKSIQKLAEETS